MNNQKKPQMMQSVIITLSDGRIVNFTGKAVVDAEPEVRIRDIKFTLPEPLPEGCDFASLPIPTQPQ